MSRQNETCKTCGDKFHWCCDCSYDGYREFGYCSEECCNDVGEFVEIEKQINLIVNEDLKIRISNMVVSYFSYDRDLKDKIIERVCRKLLR